MWRHFLDKIRQLHQYYPLEMAVIWVSSIFSLWLDNHNFAILSIYTFLFPIYFSAAFLLKKFPYGSWIAVAYSIAVTLFFKFSATAIYDNSAYFGLLTIHFLLFLTYPLLKDNRAFVYLAMTRLVQLCFAVFIALVINFALLMIYSSVEYLFNIEVINHVAKQTTIFTQIFFAPILFLLFESRNTTDEKIQFRYEIELIINYVLSPLVMIYTLIVYIYLGKIVLTSSLPQGGLAYIIVFYLSLGLLCIALHAMLTQPKWQAFYRYFTYLAIAPLGLLWVGIYARVSTYGLTEARFLLVIIATLLSIFILCSLSKKLHQYRWFTLMTAVVIFFAFIVGSPKTFVDKSQLARFEQLLQDLDLLDETNKLDKKMYEKHFGKKVTTEQASKFSQLNDIIYPYILNNPEAIAKYGREDLEHLAKIYYERVIYADDNQDERVRLTFYAYTGSETNAKKMPLDIQKYKKLYIINGYSASNLEGKEELSEEEKASLFDRKFALTDEDSGYQYAFNESYFVDVFAQAGFDIHKKYDEDELRQLSPQLTKVPTEDGGLLIFRDIDFVYETHGDIKGYVYQGGYIEFYLSPK